jgi:transposase
VPGPRPARVWLPSWLRRKLEKLARAAKTPQALVERVGIVLLAHEGLSNAEIARRLGTSKKTVSKWRNRFAQRPKESTLQDVHRSGRPSIVPLPVRLELIKLACNRPDGRRFRNTWTISSLRAALKQQTGFELSRSEIRRILRDKQMRPHRIKLWLHSPDPEFSPKVKAICEVYLAKPAPGETVLCIDEKTGMQALEHKHALQVPAPGRDGRREFEYARKGTRTLFAAFNPHTGEVFAQCSRQRRLVDLMRFMEGVAKRYPVGTVTVIWDNLNIHRPKIEVQRAARRAVPLPVHAAPCFLGQPSRDLVRHLDPSRAQARLVPQRSAATADRPRLCLVLESARSSSLQLDLPRNFLASSLMLA